MQYSAVVTKNITLASAVKEKTDSNCKSRALNSVVVSDKLTAANLQDLFEDRTCVLHIRNYASEAVRRKLDIFLQESGTDQYGDGIRSSKGGAASTGSVQVPNIKYQIGVYSYGYPLDATYNDSTGQSLQRYLSEALPAMQAIRNAAAPYLSPVDKLRVELDELWHGRVNVAALGGRKAFCGAGRILRSGAARMMSVQPHYDSVPTSYFPDIQKQFVANIALGVPGEGGVLEVWHVPPVDVENGKFAVPHNWRSFLPDPVKVRAEPGDMLLMNTRRPHSVTCVLGNKPRTSLQTFIGLTREKDVFLWA